VGPPATDPGGTVRTEKENNVIKSLYLSYHYLYQPMKLSTLYVLLLLFCLGQFSCSISIEKRRYRPGYYVNTVHSIPQKNTRQVDRVKNDSMDHNVQVHSLPPVIVSQENEKTRREEHQTIKKTINDRSLVKRSVKIPNLRIPPSHFPDKKDRIPHAVNEMSKRKITAWILGGISMLFALGSLASFAIPIASVYFFMGLMGIAVILAVLAIVYGVTKSKQQKEKEKKEKEEKNIPETINQKYFTGMFIFAVIILVISIIAMILGASYINFWLSSAIYTPTMVLFGISMTGGVVAIGLGFGGLKKENKWRTKLTIIFGFLTLIFATLALLLLLF
jgi:cation transport ATPase